MAADLAGTVIEDHYQLESLIGRGGMGAVYRARDLRLGRQVAIKVLLVDSERSPEYFGRLMREGKVLSNIEHKHIVQFYHFGRLPQGQPYIAMEYLDGRNLASVLETEPSGKLSWQRLIRLSMQVTEAMSCAHKNGIVSRDLKPENIMLVSDPSPDFVKIIDFGLAREIDDESTLSDQKLTRSGALIGTVPYMSPEQCNSQKCDQRSDIYSLGCILYQCLTGRLPFKAESVGEYVLAHIGQWPAPPDTILTSEELPPGLQNLLFKAMAKEPSERYQSMSDLSADLQLVLEGKANRIAAPESYLRFKSRKRPIPPAVVLTVCLLLAAIIGSVAWVTTTYKKVTVAKKPILTLTPEDITLYKRLFKLRKGYNARCGSFNGRQDLMQQDPAIIEVQKMIAHVRQAKPSRPSMLYGLLIELSEMENLTLGGQRNQDAWADTLKEALAAGRTSTGEFYPEAWFAVDRIGRHYQCQLDYPRARTNYSQALKLFKLAEQASKAVPHLSLPAGTVAKTGPREYADLICHNSTMGLRTRDPKSVEEVKEALTFWKDKFRHTEGYYVYGIYAMIPALVNYYRVTEQPEKAKEAFDDYVRDSQDQLIRFKHDNDIVGTSYLYIAQTSLNVERAKDVPDAISDSAKLLCLAAEIPDLNVGLKDEILKEMKHLVKHAKDCKELSRVKAVDAKILELEEQLK